MLATEVGGKIPNKQLVFCPDTALLTIPLDSNNFVIITTATTAKLDEMAKFGLKLDCVTLYNLDGGGSTSLWFRGALSGKGTQVQSSSRSVADALYFVSTEKK